MTTLRDVIRDFGTQVGDLASTKQLDQEKFDELLDLLMAEIQQMLERMTDV